MKATRAGSAARTTCAALARGDVLLIVLALTACPAPKPVAGFEGSYTVNVKSIPFEDGSEFSLYYPDEAPGGERYPLVIFSGGWNLARVSYDDTARQLAQWGYVVIIRFYPTIGIWSIGPVMTDTHIAQIGRIIDWCAEHGEREGSDLYHKVDATRVGLMGHSFGGEVTLAAAAADRVNGFGIDAVVSLDTTLGDADAGYGEMGDPGQIDAPVMYIVASEGGYCSGHLSYLEPLYDYTRPPTIEVTINGAGHMDFIERIVDPGVFGYILCPAGSRDPAEVRAIAKRYCIPWFNVFLKGEDEYRAYFNGAPAEQDERDGLVTIRRNLGD